MTEMHATDPSTAKQGFASTRGTGLRGREPAHARRLRDRSGCVYEEVIDHVRTAVLALWETVVSMARVWVWESLDDGDGTVDSAMMEGCVNADLEGDPVMMAMHAPW